MQVRVHPAGARRGRVDGVPEQPGGQVRRVAAIELAPALREQVGAPVEQRGQRRPVQPAGDQHPGGGGVHGRDRDAGPARRFGRPGGPGGGELARQAVGERGRDLRLDPALAHVVQLLDEAPGELVRQPGHVQPGQPGHHPGQQPGLAQVGAERLAHPRVLHLHRHLHDLAAAGPPLPAVHLADRGRRGRDVVEGHQPVRPARPAGGGQVSGDHPAGDLGRHGRRRVRQPPQRGPVGRRDLLRQRRLEHRHRLAQLRCAALELAQGGEHLLGGAGGNLVASGPGQPARGPGRAGSMPQRQHGQPAGTPERTGRHDRPLLAPRRRSQRPLLNLVSLSHLDLPPSDACLNGSWPGVRPGCASIRVLLVRDSPASRARHGAPVLWPLTTNTHRRPEAFRVPGPEATQLPPDSRCGAHVRRVRCWRFIHARPRSGPG